MTPNFARATNAFIHIQDASFCYPKAKVDVFAGLSLHVDRGEHLALVGPSGGGKSTLLYALGGMLKLKSGHYRFNAQAIEAMKDRELDAWRSEHVGFVYQQAALLPHLNLLDNVLLPVAHERAKNAQWRERATHLLDTLGLAELAKRLPSAVSGGQAQRVAIARALMRSPALILADEPTSALDDVAAENVMQVLQTACAGATTLVLATHDGRLLQSSTRVVPMADLVVGHAATA